MSCMKWNKSIYDYLDLGPVNWRFPQLNRGSRWDRDGAILNTVSINCLGPYQSNVSLYLLVLWIQLWRVLYATMGERSISSSEPVSLWGASLTIDRCLLPSPLTATSKFSLQGPADVSINTRPHNTRIHNTRLHNTRLHNTHLRS